MFVPFAETYCEQVFPHACQQHLVFNIARNILVNSSVYINYIILKILLFQTIIFILFISLKQKLMLFVIVSFHSSLVWNFRKTFVMFSMLREPLSCIYQRYLL